MTHHHDYYYHDHNDDEYHLRPRHKEGADMTGKSTGEVADELGTTEIRLQELIRHGKIPRPAKVRNRRVWTKKDVDAARVALERNR